LVVTQTPDLTNGPVMPFKPVRNQFVGNRPKQGFSRGRAPVNRCAAGEGPAVIIYLRLTWNPASVRLDWLAQRQNRRYFFCCHCLTITQNHVKQRTE
jgi:hypothetical protein